MNNKTTPKDFFLHIGAAIALYAAFVALISLVFSLVDYWLPDSLAYGFYSSSIAWPVSMIIVLVPVLYVLEWLLRRDIRKMPEQREIWVRRWRIYLTLFLAGAVIVGDLITLIYNYMNGEVSARFIYKILAVLIISAITFVFYISERGSGDRCNKMSTIFAWIGIVVALALIICGFIVVGSPTTQRQIRFDSQRVSDLESVQWQVISYWQSHGSMPSALSDLSESDSYFTIPTDPETKANYDYIKTASTTFKLCAIFDRASTDNSGRGVYGNNYGGLYSSMDYAPSSGSFWKHAAGNQCFEKKIDPKVYPVNKNVPVLEK